MLARRLLVLVAVLMGLTALAAGLAAPPTRTPVATPEPVAPTPAVTASAVVERTVHVDEPTTVAVDQGDEVRLTVRGDVLDAVELVGLDLLQPIAPATPAVFDVLADRPGSYPIRLTQAGEDVGKLRVTPTEE